MLGRLHEDVRAVLERDPAAKSALEVVTCYAGLHALWAHRLNHELWLAGYRLPARVLSQFVRFATGVEIHPGAVVGRRVVIDHGMGVVIGETAVVGDDVHMYHGVTLGGNSPRPEKRHPTLRDGVVVGANATLLGDIEVGENAQVGAGSVLTKDVPPGETWTGVPATQVETDDGNSTASDDATSADDETADGDAANGTTDEDEIADGDGTTDEDATVDEKGATERDELEADD
jgi:serine O-acetyltransferase